MNHLPLNQSRKAGLLKKLEPRYKSKIGFSTLESIYIVYTRDILYLRALGNYTQVHLMNGNMIMVSKTLKVIEEQLPESNFKRCHNSYVINLEEVVMLQESIFLSSYDEIPISRRKRNEFKSWFAEKVSFV